MLDNSLPAPPDPWMYGVMVMISPVIGKANSGESSLFQSLIGSIVNCNVPVVPVMEVPLVVSIPNREYCKLQCNVSVSLVEGLNETISTTKFYQYLIGFRSSPSVLNKRNFNSILATQLSIFVDGKGLKTISLIRNPNQSISTLWLKSNNISGFDFSTDRLDFVQGGEIL
ncbi:MAG: hypothetical protein ACKPB7_22770, partial [Sphaerospermopsis kisseleviana]